MITDPCPLERTALPTSIRIHTRGHPRDRATNPRRSGFPDRRRLKEKTFVYASRLTTYRFHQTSLGFSYDRIQEAKPSPVLRSMVTLTATASFMALIVAGSIRDVPLATPETKGRSARIPKTSQVLELLQLPCVRTEHSLPAQESATGVPYFAGTVTAWLVIDTCTMYERPAAFTGAG